MRYTDRSAQALDRIDAEIATRLARVGFGAEAKAKRRTRVKTSNARRSIHVIVVDPGGRRIDGEETDQNGNGTPSYPSTGNYTAFVGSNCGYYKFLELLDGALAGALSEVRSDIEREFRGMI